jgi:DNA methylase
MGYGGGPPRQFGDIEASAGGASRFFYTSKASKAERNAGLDGENTHPTVKPLDLMRYLCRLVTPEEGTVLDPFSGSGSTGCAAMLEGFNFIGIEQDRSYIAPTPSQRIGAPALLDREALPLLLDPACLHELIADPVQVVGRNAHPLSGV